MGSCICGFVQPPAPPQRHQFCDATSAPQRSRKVNLLAARRGLRDRPQAQSNTLEPHHLLLESDGRSLDQQANKGAQSNPGATHNLGSLRGAKE
jgi:hypothetical protein